MLIKVFLFKLTHYSLPLLSGLVVLTVFIITLSFQQVLEWPVCCRIPTMVLQLQLLRTFIHVFFFLRSIRSTIWERVKLADNVRNNGWILPKLAVEIAIVSHLGDDRLIYNSVICLVHK